MECLASARFTYVLECRFFKRRFDAIMGKSLDTCSHHGANWHSLDLVQLSCELGHPGIYTPCIGAVAPGSDPIMVRRIMAEAGFDIDAFWANLRPIRTLQRKAIIYRKKLSPRILGPRRWLPIRSCLCESRLATLFITLRGLKVSLSLALVVMALLPWWPIW